MKTALLSLLICAGAAWAQPGGNPPLLPQCTTARTTNCTPKVASDGSLRNGATVLDGTSIAAAGLSHPVLALTQAGAAGATNYWYCVSGTDARGGIREVCDQIAAGNAALDGTKYNIITIPAWTGTVLPVGACNVYRTTGGATQGKIGTIASCSAGGNLHDTGLAGDGATPPRETSGAITLSGPLQIGVDPVGVNPPNLFPLVVTGSYDPFIKVKAIGGAGDRNWFGFGVEPHSHEMQIISNYDAGGAGDWPIDIITAGVSRAFFTITGETGINNAAPVYGLDVSGLAHNTGPFRVRDTGGATQFVVDSSGNTTVGGVSSGNKFTVYGTSPFASIKDSAGGVLSIGVSSGSQIQIISTFAAGSYLPINIMAGGGSAVLIGTDQSVTLGGKFYMPQQTPASAGAACVANQFVADTGFLYFCTATNTWKKVAIATW